MHYLSSILASLLHIIPSSIPASVLYFISNIIYPKSHTPRPGSFNADEVPDVLLLPHLRFTETDQHFVNTRG